MGIMPHKQKIFNALLVKLYKVYMPPEYSTNLANVKTFTKGALKNIEGIEKQHTTAFDSAIIAVHQLNGSEFCLSGSKLYKL